MAADRTGSGFPGRSQAEPRRPEPGQSGLRTPEHRLLGRKSTLKGVLDSLRGTRGAGALVVAPAGCGKSTLIGEAVQGGANEFQFFRTTGGVDAGPGAYGALLAFIGGPGARSAEAPGGMFRAVSDYIERNTPKGRRPVVVMDDADALDAASIELLVQIASNSNVRVILAARPLGAAPTGLGDMVSEGVLARFDLAPPTNAELHAMCRDWLAGNVLTGTCDVLAAASGGSPRVLRALVDEGLRTGGLARRGGVWMLVDSLPETCERLVDLTRDELARLPERSAGALTTLAFLGADSAGADPGAVGEDCLTVLRDAGLVDVAPPRDGGAPRVFLTPAVHAGSLRALAPLSLRRQVFRSLPVPAGDTRQTRDDAGARYGDGAVRYTQLAAECGAEVPSGVILAAARQANARHVMPLARDLEMVLASHQGSDEFAVELALAAMREGQFTKAKAVLDELLDFATDGAVLVDAAGLSLELHMMTGNQVGGVGELEERCAEALERLSGTVGEERLGGCVRLIGAYARHLDGKRANGEGELEHLSAEGPRGHRAIALVLLAEELAATGQSRRAAETADAAWALLEGAPLWPRLSVELLMVKCIQVLVMDGDLAGAGSKLAEFRARWTHAQILLGGSIEYLAALLELKRGRVARAAMLLEAAVAGLGVFDPVGHRASATALGAYVAALRGDARVARERARKFSELFHGNGFVDEHLSRARIAAAGAMWNGTATALEELSELAAALHGRGLFGVELLVHGMMVRLDERHDGTTARLTAAKATGTYAAVFREYLGALHARSGDGAATVVELAESQGFGLLAAEAATRAATFHTSAGNHRSARVMERKIREFECATPVSTGSARGSNAAVVLTQRERDVAILAGGGAKSRDIADRLGVSVRTVEGHIYRIYEKLDIRSRDELRDRLAAG